jgi:hypothetical protein
MRHASAVFARVYSRNVFGQLSLVTRLVVQNWGFIVSPLNSKGNTLGVANRQLPHKDKANIFTKLILVLEVIQGSEP